MLRKSLIVSSLSAAGAGLAFLNQMVLAHTFGAGIELDVYFLSISLPVTLGGMLTGVLGYQVVPALQKAVVARGECDTLIKSLSVGLGTSALLAAMLGSLLSPDIYSALTPSGPHRAAASSAGIAAIAWCCIPFALIAAVYTGALQTRARFAVATACQSLPVIGTMVGCLIAPHFGGITALIAGQLTGYILMATCLRMTLGKLVSGWNWQGLRNFAGLLPVGCVALLIFVMYPFADSILGARVGPSAISILGYAQRIAIGIGGLAVVGATTVLFPELAKLGATGDAQGFRTNLATGFRVVLLAITPIAILVSTLADRVVKILLQRGAFETADSEQLAALLPYMLAGMIAVCCTTLVFKALFASGRAALAAGLSVTGAACYLLLAFALLDRGGLRGIGLAYAVSWWLLLLVAISRLRGEATPSLRLGVHHRQFLTGLAGASVALWFTAFLGSKLASVFLADDGFGTNLLVVGVSGALALGAFLLTGCRAGIPELTSLASRLRRAETGGRR